MNKAAIPLYLLCMALLGANAYLLYINNTLIQQHQADQAGQLPALGAPIIPIRIRDTTGAERSLLFPSGMQHLLLAVSPDCPYCKKNWPMWDSLIQRLPPDVSVTYFDVTGKFDKSMSVEHNIRDEQLITAPLDSAVQARIVGTPTTVLIAHDGTVRRVWQGVLVQENVDDILTLLKQK